MPWKLEALISFTPTTLKQPRSTKCRRELPTVVHTERCRGNRFNAYGSCARYSNAIGHITYLSIHTYMVATNRQRHGSVHSNYIRDRRRDAPTPAMDLVSYPTSVPGRLPSCTLFQPTALSWRSIDRCRQPEIYAASGSLRSVLLDNTSGGNPPEGRPCSTSRTYGFTRRRLTRYRTFHQ